MSNQTHHSEADQVRHGFTATGSAKHIVDDWEKNGTQRSVCNIPVRDWDEMVEDFHLDESDAEDMLYFDWCGKCDKWLRKMRYLQSMGVSTEYPDWVIQSMSEEMGYLEEGLAEVIDFLEWKEMRGYV